MGSDSCKVTQLVVTPSVCGPPSQCSSPSPWSQSCVLQRFRFVHTWVLKSPLEEPGRRWQSLWHAPSVRTGGEEERGWGSRVGGEATPDLRVGGGARGAQPCPRGQRAQALRNTAFWAWLASRVGVPATGAGAAWGPSTPCSLERSSVGRGWGSRPDALDARKASPSPKLGVLCNGLCLEGKLLCSRKMGCHFASPSLGVTDCKMRALFCAICVI